MRGRAPGICTGDNDQFVTLRDWVVENGVDLKRDDAAR